jgi:glycosyltransferase involved in cell wall biosynthesis
MYPIKGHRTMLRMLPGIVAECPDIVLLLAGDGPERGPCEVLAAELGLQNHVRFLGQRADVPQLLAASDIVALPSESEGFPISAIEALATGKPVVAFGVGGIPEVVADGATGRVVPPADTAAFVSATVALMHDDDLRAAYGVRARRAAEEFTLEAHVRQILDCYREVAATADVEWPGLETKGRRTQQWE